jgi:hypothetical protein
VAIASRVFGQFRFELFAVHDVNFGIGFVSLALVSLNADMDDVIGAFLREGTVGSRIVLRCTRLGATHQEANHAYR